jgi:hypothetical protein
MKYIIMYDATDPWDVIYGFLRLGSLDITFENTKSAKKISKLTYLDRVWRNAGLIADPYYGTLNSATSSLLMAGLIGLPVSQIFCFQMRRCKNLFSRALYMFNTDENDRRSVS